jgi:hypothetical protein
MKLSFRRRIECAAYIMDEKHVVWILRALDLEEAIKKAARENNTHAFEWLHSRGLLPPRCEEDEIFLYNHDTEDDGHTPLSTAAANGSMEVLEWMLAHDAARLEDCCACADEPLRLAAANNRLDVLEWLHARGAATLANCRTIVVTGAHHDRHSMLIAAAENGHIEVLKWLHERVGMGREDFLTVKVIVAKRGLAAALEWMQAHDLIAPDDYDRKMLLNAVWGDHVQILELMLAHGASWESLERKSSAQELYFEAGSVSMLEWLKKHGCDPSALKCGWLGCRIIKEKEREWMALQMTHAEFARYFAGTEKEWRAPRLKNMAMLILAGRKSKPRLPPELWELVHEAML